MKIYLIRHGESEDDNPIDECYGGIADFPLNDNGRETAAQLAHKLADKGIQIICSSPYKRAAETASIIGDSLGLEVVHVSGLRERNSYGVMSGVNKVKAKEIFAHVTDQLVGKPGDYYSYETVPGAEPLREFDKRVQEAFDETVNLARGYDVVCIVTHGNVTRSIYKQILGVEGKVGLDLLAITPFELFPRNIEFDPNMVEGVHLP